jgi:protein-S-isoprenylcysteine O-methyltransferase Ste14
MISKAIQKLAKRLFIFMAVAMLLGVPLSLFSGAYLNGEPNLESMNTASFLTIAGVIAFSLIVVAVMLFLLLPALIELLQAIWDSIQQARQDREAQMFP